MSRRKLLLLLAVACSLPGAAVELEGQASRRERLAAADSAYAAFDVERARQLLIAALDPAAGPLDTAWAKGVQLLAQILLEQNDSLEAGSWLRWAFRLNPGWPIDSVTFLPEVVTAAAAARSLVARGSPGDSVTRTRFIWPSGPVSAGTGAIRVVPAPSGTPVQVLVERAGLTQAGQTLQVQPGTYEIQAAAEGHLATRVSREVLPGVTTVLEFDLVPIRQVAAADTAARAPAVEQAGQAAPPPPAEPAITPRGRSPMPFILGGGAAAAGIAALVLLSGGNDSTPQGQQRGEVAVSIPVNP
jgi:hypothetical protein